MSGFFIIFQKVCISKDTKAIDGIILMMTTSSKILLSIFLVLLVLSVSASYYRFMVLQDYIVSTEVDCDPSIESCFVWICDPEVDGEEMCTGDLTEDTWYYKIAFRNAMFIPDCDSAEDENCVPFECPVTAEEGCGEITCTDETVLDYGYEEYCTNPLDFNQPDKPEVDEEIFDIEYPNTTQTIEELEDEGGSVLEENVINTQ